MTNKTKWGIIHSVPAAIGLGGWCHAPTVTQQRGTPSQRIGFSRSVIERSAEVTSMP